VNLLAAPILAILFGGFIAVAEGCNHFDDISQLHWLDMPFHDWFAGGFLIYAGLLARRDWPRGRMYQAAAWGFMASLLIAALDAHTEDWTADRAFMIVLLSLSGIAVGALVSTLHRRESPSGSYR
jgi:peptidoglycan/LPS O-acetylase OafA/YrhL